MPKKRSHEFEKSFWGSDPLRSDMAMSDALAMPIRLKPMVGMKTLVFQLRPPLRILTAIRIAAQRKKMRGAKWRIRSRREVKEGREAAAIEEVVRAGEGRGVREIRVVQPWACEDDADTDE